MRCSPRFASSKRDGCPRGWRSRRRTPTSTRPYSTIMRRKSLDEGTVTRDGIRETQRKWLAYRDAWTAFRGAPSPAPHGRRDGRRGSRRARTAQLKTVIGG